MTTLSYLSRACLSCLRLRGVAAALAGALGLLQCACSAIPPAAPEPSPLSSGAETVLKVPPKLEPGQPLERDLTAGQRDEIPLALEAGQYARLSLDQRRLDVAATLLGPTGEPIVSADGPGGRKVPETLSLVTTAGGEYRLIVTSHDARAAGPYTVKLEEMRPALPEDGDRVRADAALSEAAHRELSGEQLDVSLGLDRAQEALSLWRRIGDPLGEIRTLIVLASLQYRHNDVTEMTASLEVALALALAIHDDRGEAGALWMLAAFAKPDRETSARYFGRALEIWRNLGETAEQARVLHEKGAFEFRHGKYNAALASWQEAFDLAQRAGETTLVPDILNGIGGIYSGRGESEKALSCYERALALSREEKNRGAEAATLASMGQLLRRRGELEEALTHFRTALEINQQDENFIGQGLVLLHLGSVYVDLGDTDKALKDYEQALSLFRSIHEPSLEGLTLINLGQLYSGLKDWQAAREHFEKARIIVLQGGNRKRLGAVLHHLGVARLNLGQTAEAIQALEAALPLRREAGDRLGEASTLVELGNARKAEGNPERAASLIREALQIAERAEASFVQASALFSLAKLERDRGNLQPALDSIERSIQILEQARINLSDRLRSSFFASRRSYYDFYVDLLMRLSREDQALEASERTRARSLLDLLTEGRLDLTQGIAPELKRQEMDINASLSQIQGELMDELSRKKDLDQEKIAYLHTRLEEVESEREDLESRVRSAYPRYAGVRYASPLGLAEIRKRLDEDSALLEYSLGEEASYLFVVTREGMTVHRLPATSRIAEKVQAVRDGVEKSGRRAVSTYTRAARQLHDELIAPARPSLAGKRRLLISPDGPLHFLSFEVLLTEDDRGSEFADLPYLLRDFSMSYIPSASVLSWLADSSPAPTAAREPVKRFLAFADPIYDPEEDKTAGQPSSGERPEPVSLVVQERGLGPMPRLPGTALEVKAIAGLYPAAEVQLYERGQANEENVKINPLVETARRIHFATHGVLNKRRPELSGLRLTRSSADDGLLQVHEIFDLSLQAELVVLSACDTGSGKEVSGEGLMGMTRAFLYAGASSVVVSLWEVADAQAPDLMLSFYGGLDLTGDKAESLREAKLTMIRGRSYSRPYYWAPFILVGKP